MPAPKDELQYQKFTLRVFWHQNKNSPKSLAKTEYFESSPPAPSTHTGRVTTGNPNYFKKTLILPRWHPGLWVYQLLKFKNFPALRFQAFGDFKRFFPSKKFTNKIKRRRKVHVSKGMETNGKPSSRIGRVHL